MRSKRGGGRRTGGNTLPVLRALLVAGAIAGPHSAGAQAAADAKYPSRPIRLIVPYAPGGTPDIQARMLAEPLRDRLGQTIVVDNRQGANGLIGMEIVARSRPDGYTLVIGTVGNYAVHPHLYALPYDVLKDLAPVIHLATTPGVLVVSPAIAVRSVKELIAQAKQKPGALNYGSAGIGGFGHVSAELFATMAGIRMTHVPYKSTVVALTDTIGGTIQVLFNSLVQTVPHIKSGRVQGLATTGATRPAILPDLPTVSEAAVPGYENSTWSALAAPAGTPRAIVERLNREFNAVLKMPDIQEKFAASASTVTAGTPQQCRDIIVAETAKYARLVKAAGIKADRGG